MTTCDQRDVADTETCEYNQKDHPADSQKPELSEDSCLQTLSLGVVILKSNIEYRKPDSEVDRSHPCICPKSSIGQTLCKILDNKTNIFLPFHLSWKTKLPAIPSGGYNLPKEETSAQARAGEDGSGEGG